MDISAIMPLLNDISPYWLTIWIIIFQQWVITKREKRIDTLIEVNKDHTEAIKEMNMELRFITRRDFTNTNHSNQWEIQ